MPKFEDITGQRFGRLTVVSRAENKRYQATWVCRCDCGKERRITTGTLRFGHTMSCGCIKSPDITGQRFGRYVVISRVEKGDGQSWWDCLCDCGKQKEVRGRRLRSGVTLSCGCYAADRTSRRSRIHGATTTAEHKVWSGMIERCANVNDPNYGGRGITVCERWRESFLSFMADMGPRPVDGRRWSIDRIDNEGNYEPGNCRWTVPRVQCRNTRANRHLEHDGRRLTVVEWAEVTGLHPDLIRERVAGGWPVDRALATPPRRRKDNRRSAQPSTDMTATV